MKINWPEFLIKCLCLSLGLVALFIGCQIAFIKDGYKVGKELVEP